MSKQECAVCGGVVISDFDGSLVCCVCRCRPTNWDKLASSAYKAYSDYLDNLVAAKEEYAGAYHWNWEALTPAIRQAWIAAVREISNGC